MTELQDALDDVAAMRRQLVSGTEFRGYGPTTLAATGALALLVAVAQSHRPPTGTGTVHVFLRTWTCVAVVALILIGVDTITRVRRAYTGLAMRMLYSAVELFLPPVVAGILVMVVLTRCVPASPWMLPGLWQLLFSLGVFASCRLRPRPIFAVGVWYLVSGLTCIAIGGDRGFSPWELIIPFGIGQLAVAAVLKFGYRDPAPTAQ